MRKIVAVWILSLMMSSVGCVAYGPGELEEEGAGFCAWERKGDQPEVVSPEIVVSLGGLTLHLFDRETGQSWVYPVGVGTKRADGRSITPVGHFTTGASDGLPWFYTCRADAAFGGYPFIRLASGGAFTHYGMHGPITKTLRRGYVSHGCVRMEGLDVGQMYEILEGHYETPITIQTAVELDAAGNPVDVGQDAVLFPPGEEVPVDQLDLALAGEFVDDPAAEYDEGSDDPFDGDADGEDDDWYEIASATPDDDEGA